jgi:hypothetical protein
MPKPFTSFRMEDIVAGTEKALGAGYAEGSTNWANERDQNDHFHQDE